MSIYTEIEPVYAATTPIPTPTPTPVPAPTPTPGILTGEIADQLIAEQGLDVVIPDIYTSIQWGAFDGKGLTSVVIPDSVISIGYNAFYDNQLAIIVIPDSITSIDYIAFSSNQLTYVYIPDSVAYLDDHAFISNPLRSISISSDGPSFDSNPWWSDRKITVIRRDPSPFDLDDDGFTDGVAKYQMWNSDIGYIDLISKKGRSLSDKTSKSWDAIRALQTNDGFLILLEGHLKKQSKYKTWKTGKNGKVKSQSSWMSGRQMFEAGYEDVFAIDFNENGQIGFGVPTGISLSSFAFNENIPAGSVVSLLSSDDPDPGDLHSYSLVDGSGDDDNDEFIIKGNQLKIVASPDYESKSSYSIRLRTTDSSAPLFYESPLTLTVNDLYEPILEDQDGNGFVDGITNYQVLTSSGGVDLTNKKGRKLSNVSSRLWDAVKAIATDVSIQVLVEGAAKKDGKFKVWFANSETGKIQSQTKWQNESWMTSKGYEEIFDYDINGNGLIGS